jgi:hypothetical protein
LSSLNYSRVQEAFERLTLKIRVLTHYGKGKQLKCSYHGCQVTDPDLLSLDHKNGVTKADRQESGRRRAGSSLHKWVEARGYPKGFATLCYNHQMKKELLLRRKQ